MRAFSVMLKCNRPKKLNAYASALADPVTECPGCSWPDSDVYEIVSRHLTSDGVVTYSRCACGRMQVRFQPFDQAR